MLVFIDESGCLGFDFTKQKTSKYLILTALVCKNNNTDKMFKTAVKRTLRNKINRKAKHPKNELHGSCTPLSVKNYFYQQLNEDNPNWGIYSIALNKQRVYPHLQNKYSKHKLYNHTVKFLIDQINIDDDVNDLSIIIDKSKNSNQRSDFNRYIKWHFENKTNLNCNIHLYHPASYEYEGLQAVDLFCWGIARKLNCSG